MSPYEDSPRGTLNAPWADDPWLPGELVTSPATVAPRAPERLGRDPGNFFAWLVYVVEWQDPPDEFPDTLDTATVAAVCRPATPEHPRRGWDEFRLFLIRFVAYGRWTTDIRPRVGTVATVMGLSRKTAQRYLAVARALGLLVQVKAGSSRGMPAVYELALPPDDGD